MINEEFEKNHINPIVGYIFHSAKQLGLDNAPNEMDWRYLKEGTRRIRELVETSLKQTTAPDALEDASMNKETDFLTQENSPIQETPQPTDCPHCGGYWSHMATSEGVQCPTIDSKNQPVSPEQSR